MVFNEGGAEAPPFFVCASHKLTHKFAKFQFFTEYIGGLERLI